MTYAVTKPVVANNTELKWGSYDAYASFDVLREYQLRKSGVLKGTKEQIATFKQSFNSIYEGLSDAEMIQQCALQTGYDIKQVRAYCSINRKRRQKAMSNK